VTTANGDKNDNNQMAATKQQKQPLQSGNENGNRDKSSTVIQANGSWEQHHCS